MKLTKLVDQINIDTLDNIQNPIEEIIYSVYNKKQQLQDFLYQNYYENYLKHNGVKEDNFLSDVLEFSKNIILGNNNFSSLDFSVYGEYENFYKKLVIICIKRMWLYNTIEILKYNVMNGNNDLENVEVTDLNNLFL